jgi:hypothetical protein
MIAQHPSPRPLLLRRTDHQRHQASPVSVEEEVGPDRRFGLRVCEGTRTNLHLSATRLARAVPVAPRAEQTSARSSVVWLAVSLRSLSSHLYSSSCDADEDAKTHRCFPELRTRDQEGCLTEVDGTHRRIWTFSVREKTHMDGRVRNTCITRMTIHQEVTNLSRTSVVSRTRNLCKRLLAFRGQERVMKANRTARPWRAGPVDPNPLVWPISDNRILPLMAWLRQVLPQDIRV